MSDKRGLSTIVITLIIVLVSLVAVGIIWVVVRNILKTGGEGVTLDQFTIDARISNVKVDTSANNITLTIKRQPGGGEVTGIKFLFESDGEPEVMTEYFTLNELESRQFEFHLNANVSLVNKISVVPLFKTSGGEEKQGSIVSSYSFGGGGGGSSGSSGGETPCTPTTCSALGYTCGVWDDGCGGLLRCGTCGSSYGCMYGTCVAGSSSILCNPNTHYIDFWGGDDSSNGTCSNSAWKHAPYMTGFTGSYAHSAGDRFIFKGGVIWDSSSFPMTISSGGIPSNWDYYGVDSGWYIGSSWTRPVFDNGGISDSRFFVFQANNIRVDNLEMTGYYWAANDKPDGSYSYVYFGTSANVTVSNSYLHSWSHGGSSIDNLDIFRSSLDGSVDWADEQFVINCTIDGSPSGSNSGMAWNGGGVLRNTTIKNIPNGFSPKAINAEISSCNLGPITSSFTYRDASAISDTGITGVFKLFNNRVHDISSDVTLVLGGNGDTIYVYNNLLYNFDNIPIVFQTVEGSGSAYVFNNVIDISDMGSFLYPVAQIGGNPWNYLEVRNNYIIAVTSIPLAIYGDYDVLIETNNILQSVANATAYGYTTANLYRPVNATAVTVDTGFSLAGRANETTGPLDKDINGVSRPQLSGWDIGVYEYV